MTASSSQSKPNSGNSASHQNLQIGIQNMTLTVNKPVYGGKSGAKTSLPINQNPTFSTSIYNAVGFTNSRTTTKTKTSGPNGNIVVSNHKVTQSLYGTNKSSRQTNSQQGAGALSHTARSLGVPTVTNSVSGNKGPASKPTQSPSVLSATINVTHVANIVPGGISGQSGSGVQGGHSNHAGSGGGSGGGNGGDNAVGPKITTSKFNCMLNLGRKIKKI